MPHRFDPENLAHLDNPLRALLLPPKRILEGMGLARGDFFLDIGAGSGHFSFPASEIVGPEGQVLAIDAAPAAIELLARKKESLGRDNLSLRLSEASELDAPPGAANLALMSLVLHEIEDKAAALASIARALLPGGRLAIIEFRESAFVPGPPKSERIAKGALEALLKAAGFTEIAFAGLGPFWYLSTARI